MRSRINEHRAGIRKAYKEKDFSHKIYGHFVKGHGKNPEAYLQVTGIERILLRGNDQLRKVRESRQHKGIKNERIRVFWLQTM